jgi:hypothetical protein
MLEREITERVADLLRISLFDVVRSLGGEPVSLDTDGPDKPRAEALVVLVEFGNEQVQGRFGLRAEQRFFSHVGPKIRLDDERFLTDWACEFANQAVGCFRNRMRAYGPLLMAKPPHLATPEEAHFSATSHSLRILIRVGVEGMVLSAWIDLEGPLTLPMSDSPDEALAAEMPTHGDVLLF